MFGCLNEGREETGSHFRDGHLVGELNAVVQFLGTHNTVALGVHHESANAGVGGVFRIVVRQEVLLVDSNVARDVLFALQSLNLGKHQFLVLRHSILNYTLKQVNVSFSAPEGHFGFNEFDESLHK